MPEDPSTGLSSGLAFESPTPLGSQRKTSQGVLCLSNTPRQETEGAFSELLQTDHYQPDITLVLFFYGTKPYNVGNRSDVS